MSDRVYIDGLVVPCRVGVSSAERRMPQDVVVSISVFLDLRRAGMKDLLTETVDYRKVRQAVVDVASEGQFSLLEGVAETLAATMIERFYAERVVVNVKKSKYSAGPAIGVEVDRRATVG